MVWGVGPNTPTHPPMHNPPPSKTSPKPAKNAYKGLQPGLWQGKADTPGARVGDPAPPPEGGVCRCLVSLWAEGRPLVTCAPRTSSPALRRLRSSSLISSSRCTLATWCQGPPAMTAYYINFVVQKHGPLLVTFIAGESQNCFQKNKNVGDPLSGF